MSKRNWWALGGGIGLLLVLSAVFFGGTRWASKKDPVSSVTELVVARLQVAAAAEALRREAEKETPAKTTTTDEAKLDFFAAYMSAGHNLLIKGELPAAEAAYREAIRLKPGDTSAQTGLRSVQLLSGVTPDNARPVSSKPGYADAPNVGVFVE